MGSKTPRTFIDFLSGPFLLVFPFLFPNLRPLSELILSGPDAQCRGAGETMSQSSDISLIPFSSSILEIQQLAGSRPWDSGGLGHPPNVTGSCVGGRAQSPNSRTNFYHDLPSGLIKKYFGVRKRSKRLLSRHPREGSLGPAASIPGGLSTTGPPFTGKDSRESRRVPFDGRCEPETPANRQYNFGVFNLHVECSGN